MFEPWRKVGAGVGSTEGVRHVVNAEIHRNGVSWKVVFIERSDVISGRGGNYADTRLDALQAAHDAGFNARLVRIALTAAEKSAEDAGML